ncbi:hypothetical protein MSAN_01228600 [Mycena sanguinolenta]|uniref:Uncharacterized protein n=1 Tax=Mycena sanguinolenta TaxID=230812 RepID=A0A8H6YFS6_9AGAR|nr:hypothetical protein MSAN_01228600 [Mycena sanguinolenta]
MRVRIACSFSSPQRSHGAHQLPAPSRSTNAATSTRFGRCYTSVGVGEALPVDSLPPAFARTRSTPHLPHGLDYALVLKIEGFFTAAHPSAHRHSVNPSTSRAQGRGRARGSPPQFPHRSFHLLPTLLRASIASGAAPYHGQSWRGGRGPESTSTVFRTHSGAGNVLLPAVVLESSSTLAFSASTAKAKAPPPPRYIFARCGYPSSKRYSSSPVSKPCLPCAFHHHPRLFVRLYGCGDVLALIADAHSTPHRKSALLHEPRGSL